MNDLNQPAYKIYSGVLQFSILAFTLALVYFAFVYYPKVVANYKAGKVPPAKPVIAPVAAVSGKFPIETKNFRIVYEEGADTYYVFVAGERLDQFLLNRNSASLTLKSVLSAESLCNYNVIYSSAASLEVSEKYKQEPNCD